MKIFNCEELCNLVKKVVDGKLIDECADTFPKSAGSVFHFLSYDEMIEVCAMLDKYTSICNIKSNKAYDTLYCFTDFIYNENDFMEIAGQAIYIKDYDSSDYTLKVVFIDETDNWHIIFLVREFWEFCENSMNKNEKEDEEKENVNNKTTEIKEETLSIQDIYKIITDSEGFEKIIEGMEDIGFTDETIYEVILNLVKRLN